WTGNEPHAAPWQYHLELASGRVWTTPTDLLKLVRAAQASLGPDDGGVPGTKTARFLSPELAREMLTEVEGGMALSRMVSRRTDHALGHWGGNNPSIGCCAIGFADASGGVERRDLEERCGVIVMANGWEGHHACAKVVHVVAHLKGWAYLGTLEHTQEPAAPLRDPARKMGGRLAIERSEDGGPKARFGGLESMALVPAAIWAERGEDGGETSIDFLVGEMAVMLRLQEAEGARIVEVWNGLTFRAETLERV
ncbi:hypothetical protein LZ32DRAFT_534935, partial [Colletotrichum eremochloae]